MCFCLLFTFECFDLWRAGQAWVAGEGRGYLRWQWLIGSKEGCLAATVVIPRSPKKCSVRNGLMNHVSRQKGRTPWSPDVWRHGDIKSFTSWKCIYRTPSFHYIVSAFTTCPTKPLICIIDKQQNHEEKAFYLLLFLDFYYREHVLAG